MIPVGYLLVSLFLTWITVDRVETKQLFDKTIYLNTNGVHLDIIIPSENMDESLLKGLEQRSRDRFYSFGWGDENFYINTPTWGDLTFNNAFTALFLDSSTLIHVTRYSKVRTDWIVIKISENELEKLNTYILNSFKINEEGHKISIPYAGYSSTDNFYIAEGSYSCFKTCNSWVNNAFKESGLESCLWTPFDFGLMDKYR